MRAVTPEGCCAGSESGSRWKPSLPLETAPGLKYRGARGCFTYSGRYAQQPHTLYFAQTDSNPQRRCRTHTALYRHSKRTLCPGLSPFMMKAAPISAPSSPLGPSRVGAMAGCHFSAACSRTLRIIIHSIREWVEISGEALECRSQSYSKN